MLVKIGRLISLCFNIIIVIHKKMQKKTHINIAFHNFKIICAGNKTELTFQNC